MTKRRKIANTMIAMSMLSVLFGFAPKEKKYEKELRPVMRGMYSSLQGLLGYYLDRDDFMDPRNDKAIRETLHAFEKQANLVAAKTRRFDQELKIYGEAVADDAKRAYQSFNKGAKNHSYFYMEELINTCFSCHTSRETKKDSKFVQLSDSVDLSELDPLMLPRFYVLARQFDKALTAYEDLFESQTLSLSEVLHFDPFLNYLIISIRTKHEIERPVALFQKLLKKNYPESVKRDFRTWLSSLKEISKTRKQRPSLRLAESWIAKGRLLMEYPRDQGGVIYYIEASRLLKDIISDSKAKNAQDKAKAAYLLGVTELVIGHPILGLEAQQYLEKAIRLSPHSDLADEAFSLYEENLIFAYSGSAGLNLPETEKNRLETLRKLAKKK